MLKSDNGSLSVITICLNDPGIKKTCISIAEQTYKNFNWIVIDGGSNNETISILQEYQKYMYYFISEKDYGIYHAMNKGIKKAASEYINFMNAGDTYYNKYSLEIISKYLQNYDIIYGNALFETKDGSFLKKCPDALPPEWFKKDCIPHQATYIKRELFDHYGFYNENNKIISDWEKWIVFIEINKCSYLHIDKTIAIHNYTGISSNTSQLHSKEKEAVIKKYYFS